MTRRSLRPPARRPVRLATLRTAGATAAARTPGDGAVDTGHRDPVTLLADGGRRGCAAAVDGPRHDGTSVLLTDQVWQRCAW
ncbi:hypothetical protein WDA79_17635 [Streptomyces sp. A475]|uniref:hypothetical protein n=1 Tax=Streptomyces sp. A475 TaxID=3131976 RepID=UPI0030CA0BC5